jgi:hypothetical protein
MNRLGLIACVLGLGAGVACRWWPPGRWVEGNQFVVLPYAYRGESITLKISVSPRWQDGTRLRVADASPSVFIRFENADRWPWQVGRVYLVTFECRAGSLYWGNWIKRVTLLR